MADVASAVRSYLLNNTGTTLTSIIGDRIYPDAIPQGEVRTSIVYNKISTTHEHVTGSSWGLAGMASCRLEFECYASTRSAANNLADVLKRSIIGSLRGVYAGINFFDVMIGSGQRTFVDPPTDGSDERRYVTSIEFMVSYFDS